MSQKQGGATTKEIAVDTVAKLLRKLGSQHDIGMVYQYLYQNSVVVTADSTKAGKLSITVMPSAWATQIAEYIWQYELEGDNLVDPTIADPSVHGWSAVMLTDAPETDSDELSYDEEAERIADSEAEAEQQLAEASE